MKIPATILAFLFFNLPILLRAQTDTLQSSDSLPERPPAQLEETNTETDSVVYFRKNESSTADSIILQRNVPDSVVDKMEADNDFWYANKDLNKPKPEIKHYTPFFQRHAVRVIVWILIIAVFASALMWWLYTNSILMLRKKNRVLAEPETVAEEAETENVFHINFDKAIPAAEAKGNYRLAARLLYLRSIRELTERKLISFKQDKTNFDYLLQMQTSSLYDPFFRLTRIYEYSWYGLFNVDASMYAKIREAFAGFHQQLIMA